MLDIRSKAATIDHCSSLFATSCHCSPLFAPFETIRTIRDYSLFTIRDYSPFSIRVFQAPVSARLPPVCPGFDSRTRSHMWVEFVVGSSSSLLREVFLRVLWFYPLLKNQHFQIPISSRLLSSTSS